MSLFVDHNKVKVWCGITETDLDTEILSVISTLVPPIEYAIKPEHIADASNTGLQSTLNLGALEIVAGEYFAILSHKPGTFDTVTVDRFEVRPYVGTDANDPSGWKNQGWARLRPYLSVDPALPAMADVRTASRFREGS